MANVIEIEYKCMISKEEYQKISLFYQQQGKIVTQTNYYFDTIDHSLQKNKYSLRVRKLNQTYEMTLKVPIKTGRLEMNFMINEDEFEKMKQYHIHCPGIMNELKKLNIKEKDIHYITSLTTTRQEIILPQGILCIDQNTYSHMTDYELELEVNEKKQGEKDFIDLLARFDIPYIPSQYGKMNRAIRAKSERN